MRITKIEEQKKHKNRFSVFIDGKFSFGIDRFSLFKLKLKENDEIDEERLSYIKDTVLFEDSKNYALRLLSARAYTEKTMVAKLTSYSGDTIVLQKVIEFLKEYNFIDDENYAVRYASDCINIKKYGRRKIKFKLIEKGILPALAESVVANLDQSDTEKENLLALAEKKLKGDFDIKNVMKTKRYLASRGYSFDDIDSTLRKLTSESGDDW